MHWQGRSLLALYTLLQLRIYLGIMSGYISQTLDVQF